MASYIVGNKHIDTPEVIFARQFSEVVGFARETQIYEREESTESEEK